MLNTSKTRQPLSLITSEVIERPKNIRSLAFLAPKFVFTKNFGYNVRGSRSFNQLGNISNDGSDISIARPLTNKLLPNSSIIDKILTHVEHTLLNYINDKDINNRSAALLSLYSLINSSTTFINNLMINNILGSLISVLEQPYQKTIWSSMNSYIWSESEENSELNKIERITLHILISLASKSDVVRNVMAKDLLLKQTLLKIYFYTAQKSKSDPLLAVDNTAKASNDTKTLIKSLFMYMGYKINDDVSLDGMIGDKDKKWSWDKLLTFSNSPDGNIADLLIEVDNVDTVASDINNVIWIPYCYRNDDPTESLIRHINMSVLTVTSTTDFKNLNHVTVPAQTTITNDEPVLGILAIEKDSSTYTLLANVILKPFEFLNEEIVILNMLNIIEKTCDFNILNDIFAELWQLLGSKSTKIIGLITKNLNQPSITSIINATNKFIRPERSTSPDDAIHTDVPFTIYKSPPMADPSVLDKYIENFGLGSYYEALKNFLKRDNIISRIYNKMFTTKVTPLQIIERTETNPETECTNSDTVDQSYLIPGNSIESSKRLQTTILGFITELVYIDGSRTFKNIRDDHPLIDAIKTLKSYYPDTLTLTDLSQEFISNASVASPPPTYTPILDNRRHYKNITTNVIENSSPVLRAINSADVMADGFNASELLKSSYKRQRYCKLEDSGPIFNSNKLLNILGHHDQNKIKGRGVRILSIDGGGSKGVVALEILDKISTLMNKPIHELFDVICGTSTGGLLAALIALEKIEVEHIKKLFDSLVARIFAKDSYHIASARLLMRYAMYDEHSFNEILNNTLDNFELIDYSTDSKCPKFFCLSTQLDISPLKPIIWRNYNYPPDVYDGVKCTSIMSGSCIIKLSDAIRATTAAPGYFLPFERNGHLYGDGALHSNNPSLIAFLETKLIYPNLPIECLVSIGNGNISRTPIHANGSETVEAVKDTTIQYIDHGLNLNLKDSNVIQLSLDQLISQLINAATNTEVIDSALVNLLPYCSYFRFNPDIPNVKIDETNHAILESLKSTTREYLQSEEVEKKLNTLKRLMLIV